VSGFPLHGAGAETALPGPGTPGRQRLFFAFLAVAVVTVVGASLLRVQANPILAAFTGILVILAWQRFLLAWPVMLGYVLAVILFIPIRRYTIAGGGPISLEPYRLLIAIVLLCWFGALLVDPRTRWRNTGFEAPVVLLAISILASIGLNLGRVGTVGVSEIVKQVSFFASFLLVMYFAASVLPRIRDIDRILAFTVAGASIVALFSIVESRTSFNPFNMLERFIPLLQLDLDATAGPPERGGRVRAYASAQHPIALGAMLVLLLPIAVYLYRRKGRLGWMACAAALTLGALATGSRTAALMLVVELIAFFWMKRKETIRLLPLLLPLFVVVQVVMPGTLGTFKAILFPEGGVIAEQKGGGGGTGSGRIADLGPGLQEFAQTPFFGQGFGTRIPLVNAQILDNEWLGTLLEIGAIGALSLLWLYVKVIRSLARRAKADESAHGWLLAGRGSALTAFAVGLLTYDAFSFIQVTFLSFILIGVAAVAIRHTDEADAAHERAEGTWPNGQSGTAGPSIPVPAWRT